MAATDDKARMLERHKLVVSMIEVNSRQLRCETLWAGADIERACARREAAQPGASPAAAELVTVIETRLKALDEERRRLRTEREWLEAELAEFDGGVAAKQRGPVGRA